MSNRRVGFQEDPLRVCRCLMPFEVRINRYRYGDWIRRKLPAVQPSPAIQIVQRPERPRAALQTPPAESHGPTRLTHLPRDRLTLRLVRFGQTGRSSMRPMLRVIDQRRRNRMELRRRRDRNPPEDLRHRVQCSTQNEMDHLPVPNLMILRHCWLPAR